MNCLLKFKEKYYGIHFLNHAFFYTGRVSFLKFLHPEILY